MMTRQYTLDLTNIDHGKIKTKIYKGKRNYKIFNCINEADISEDDDTKQFRSIITDEDGTRIVCYSPPKTSSYEYFKQENNISNESIIVNELIEGTMITLFYDNELNCWEIATKGAVGGNYWFFRTDYEKKSGQKTFRKMFLESLRASENEDLDSSPCISQFSKEYCYTFILQHPENHIVFNIDIPQVFLVSVFKIDNLSITEIAMNEYEKWDFLNTDIISFPKRFLKNTYEKLESTYASIQSSNDYVGLMFTNMETGMRSSLENPVYSEIRALRGNHPNLQYQYLCLLKTEKVMDFIRHFPQYNNLFFGFYKDFQSFITNLHQSYVSYYIKKTGDKISKRYFPLIHKLHHNVYIPSLSTGEKQIMKRAVVYKYIVDMHPVEIIYFLNYNRD